MVTAGALWAVSPIVPPSSDTVQGAYEQSMANGSAHLGGSVDPVWSVSGMLGHMWTCSAMLIDVTTPRFIALGRYECSPSRSD